MNCSTVYLDADVHRALRVKAAASGRSISSIIKEAVKLALAEDADDLAVFQSRASEPLLDFEERAKGSLQRRAK